MRLCEVHVDDEGYMALALEEAEAAAKAGEVPVGAIVVVDGRVIGRGHNMREGRQDPTAHAEILALRQAAATLNCWRLCGSTLYVTLEPCIMCMGACILARVERIVFGTRDPKGGAAGSLYDFSKDPRLNHQIELLGGVRKDECSALLSAFFRELRSRRHKAKVLASKSERGSKPG